jgi:chitodextrinase
MKRLRLLSLVAAGLVAGGVLSTTQLASAATNLVTNPGFESGLSGWACSGGSTVGSPVHGGAAALSGAVSNSDTAQCTQNVAVVSGAQYTLSAWVQGNYVYLGVTGGASTWTPGTGGWSQLTVNFTATSGSAQIYLHGWYAQGSYFADDVSLTGPGGTVTPPPAPTGLAVTGTTSSSVSLSWSASAGATGYNVYQGGAKVASVGGTSATISGLAASTTYSFQVSATNSAGESARSGTVSATTGSGTGTPPATPTGLRASSIGPTSLTLSWNASTGATGYKIYRGTNVTTVTGTSANVTGLNAATTYTFTVSATNAAGESPKSAPLTVSTPGNDPPPPGSPRSWPYIDITMSTPTLADVARATGQKFFTLAFVLGSSAGCVPSWGGTIDLNDARITKEINDLRALGGDVAVSFGGAAGPYLQQTCPSQAAQVGAIERVMDTFNVRHIDFDIEASVPFDPMNKAIAQVQRERSGTVVSYTLMVQGDDFGVTPSLGVDLLKNAKANGVNVGIVNPMTMDFGSSREWGDAVIAAAQATLGQMAQIWPEKSSSALNRMLGVTPMIGRNDTGPIFSIADGQKLITWANNNHIGLVAFWSVGRDNGGCPGGGVSPTCSSISQSQYQFTMIFGGFSG